MTHRRAIRILIVALVVFAFFALNNHRRARGLAQQRQCAGHLRDIEGIKEQFAIDHDGIGPESFDDLIPDYLAQIPRCPAQGDYVLGDLQEPSSCSRESHRVEW